MLLVLGMHRSGTSVCTRLLECLGAVPSAHLLPAITGVNNKGFFEDYDVYQFNETELLPRLGRSWYSTTPVDWSQLSDTDRSRLTLRAVQILRTNYTTSAPLSVLKEPRIGILLPFWLPVLNHAGYDVRVVCAVRDPLSVAASLAQRDGFSTTHSGLLFLSHWLSVASFLKNLPVAFAQFHEALAEPHKVLEKVAHKLDLRTANDFYSNIDKAATDFLDTKLCHHRFDIRDLELEPDMPALTLDLYRELVRAAQTQRLTPILKLATAKARELSLLQPVFVDFDRTYAGLRSERKNAAALNQRVAQLENQLSLANQRDYARERGQLAERITKLQSENSNLATTLEQLKSQNSSLTAERNDLTARISTLQSELQEQLNKRNKDFSALAKRLVATQKDLEGLHKRRHDFGPMGCSIRQTSLAGIHASPPHRHLDILLEDIQRPAKQIDSLRFRLVEHHSRFGFCIFSTLFGAPPMDHWQQHGEEIGAPYMLVIPSSKSGLRTLGQFSEADLGFLLTVLAATERAIHAAAALGNPPDTKADEYTPWLTCLAQLRPLLASALAAKDKS